jgi:predicted nucleic acid-binding protein
MNMTFADTFYYLALLNPGDAAHQRALVTTAQRTGQLVTTRWILTEVGDAMAAPQYRRRFLNLIRAVESDPDTIIVPSTDELFKNGLTLFSERMDKTWRITDCISFIVMKQFSINEALTGDQHFAQAGFVPLLRSQ